MDKYDLIELDYKLKHTRSAQQIRKIIDSYPDLVGRNVSDIKKMVMVNKWVTTGITIEQQKRNKQAKVIHTRIRKFNFED